MDVLLQILKLDSYKYQFFKKKWAINKPISPILGQILSKIAQFFQNVLKYEQSLAQIWENFESRPIHTPNFAFYKESYTKHWFFYSCWQHVPVGSFVLSTPCPPPGFWPVNSTIHISTVCAVVIFDGIVISDKIFSKISIFTTNVFLAHLMEAGTFVLYWLCQSQTSNMKINDAAS